MFKIQMTQNGTPLQRYELGGVYDMSQETSINDPESYQQPITLGRE